MVPRYKLTIAYDGTDFCGWQKQEPLVGEGGLENLVRPGTAGELKLQVQGLVQREGEARQRAQMRTVQHVVERAVREIVREPVQVQGASRTDAGVHAKGQVAAFSCSGEEETEGRADGGTDAAAAPGGTVSGGPGSENPDAPSPAPPSTGRIEPAPASGRGGGWPMSRGVERLVRAINGRLPDDVLVVACEPVAPGFDPIGHCTAKGYTYTIHASRTRPLWDRRYVAQVWEPLDVDRMQEAARHLVGEHDFAAFAAAGHGRLTTVRTVFECRVVETEGTEGRRGDHQGIEAGRVRIEVSGNGFLYNMVRIIAGTLVEVGKGRMSAGDVAAAVESGDRRRAGPTMPPEGLCLEWVRY
jgi:tRNA pseudouridine38-40 synthase